MILADTSAWVEYDRATGSAVDERITSLVDDGTVLAITEPVAMEVGVGARNDDHAVQLERLLAGCHLLRFDAASDFEGATRIYSQCRQVGVTPRGLIDCMIATVAWRSGAALLTADADQHRIAEVIGLELDVA